MKEVSALIPPIPHSAQTVQSGAASLPAGAPVRVRSGEPLTHCRTPYYLRGKHGRVLRSLGRFANPEELAYHRPGLPPLTLYQVEFDATEVWGERLGKHPGESAFRIVADIFEHWLEPIPSSSPGAPQ